MRSDFKYVPTVSISIANGKARRRSKKALLTGAAAATFFSGLWQAGVVLLGLLTVTNIVQKNIPIERSN